MSGAGAGRKCPECGQLAAARDEQCSRCGAPLSSSSAHTACWNCNAPTPAGMDGYCPRCGVPISRGRRPVVEAASTEPSSPPVSFDAALARAGLRPRRRGRAPWIVAGALFGALVVVTVLWLSGAGDHLIGRNFYTGSNPPPTNVTVIAVNVTDTVTYTASGTNVVSSQTLVPPNAPYFNVGGAHLTVAVPFIDQVSNTTLTIHTVTASSGFSLVSVDPVLPIVLSAGVITWVSFTVLVEASPGFYIVHLLVDSSIT